MIGSFPSDGDGYTNVGELLCRRFREDGHRVLVASRRRSRVRKLLDILGKLFLGRNEYDVVLIEVFSTAALWYAYLAVRLGRVLNKRLVGVLHGGSLPLLARAGSPRLRAVLGGLDVIVAPSPYLQREVGGVLGRNVVVIPNPVDFERLPRRIRRKASPRLFWLRAFQQIYLPEVPIRAVAALRARFPEVHLTMAGPDKDGSLQACRRLVRELSVGEAVEFTGMIGKDRIGKIGGESDIFLNSSSVDNTPLSVLEALAMGLCVVTTDVGGIGDMLVDGREALFVRPGSPDEVSAAVARILEEPGLAESLSREALRASSRFEMKAVASLWYELLEDLVAQARSPG